MILIFQTGAWGQWTVWELQTPSGVRTLDGTWTLSGMQILSGIWTLNGAQALSGTQTLGGWTLHGIQTVEIWIVVIIQNNTTYITTTIISCHIDKAFTCSKMCKIGHMHILEHFL